MSVAVIAGATGLTGSFLIQKLLADPQIKKVISVSRKSLELQSAKLFEVIVKDLSEIENLSDQLHGDIYFCCLGSTIKSAGSKENFFKIDHDAIVTFAKIAKANQAKLFSLVSAMGANPKSFAFYNKVKGQTENDLKALELQSLHIFRPGLLIGPRKEFRLAERIFVHISAALVPILPTSLTDRWTTDVSLLAHNMWKESKSAPTPLKIFEAPQIN